MIHNHGHVSSMRLDTLQVGRGFAALMVVAFHANVFILPQRLYDGGQAWRGFNMGYAGVEFFFVLSGFIMVFVHLPDVGQPARARRFLRKRFQRIYPTYWVVLGALLIAYTTLPGFGPPNAHDPVAVVSSFLLFPRPELPILGIAWTLEFEMFFYILLATAIVLPRVGLLLISAWAVACTLGLFVPFRAYPWDFVFSHYNIIFVFGMAAALFYRRVPPRREVLVSVGGGLLFLAVGMSEAYGLVTWDEGWRTVLYGFGGTFIVAALAALSERRRPTLPRSAIFIGDASYAIYLVHVPAMSVGALVADELGLQALLRPMEMIALMVAFGVSAGAVVHVFVERPVLQAMANGWRVRGWSIRSRLSLRPSRDQENK